jgi:uncharacterized protein YbcC (UPF0753/DUF2309 family)
VPYLWILNRTRGRPFSLTAHWQTQAKRLTVWLPKNIYGRSSSTLGRINKRSACINLQHVIESTNTHMIQRHGVRVMNADAVLA